MKRIRKGMNAQCCNATKLMSESFYNASLSYIRIFTFFSVRVKWGLRAPLLLEFFLFLFRFPKTGPPTLREVLSLATLKQRLHMKNSSGTYDVVHLETSASLITAGTLVAGVLAATGTDYTTYRIRNIAIVTSVPTSMNNGDVALVIAT